MSGISASLSPGAEEAVLLAAGTVAAAGAHVTYDHNFRNRLTTQGRALGVLRRMAPLAGLLTPSCPGDSGPLLATTDPVEAVERGLALGAAVVAVTRLVPGDSLDTALSVGVPAAVLATTRHSGTGYLPTPHESQTAGPTTGAVRTAIDARTPGARERA